MMTNRAVMPEWRDRAGTLFVPVRRTAAGGIEYKRAEVQDQRPTRQLLAPHHPAENVSLLSDRLRALGYGERTPAAAAQEAAPKPPADREALSLDGLKRFQLAVAQTR